MSNPGIKPVKNRRSSLKMGNPGDVDINKLKSSNKRNSVSWGLSNTFKFKEMKALFQDSSEVKKLEGEEQLKKHGEFVEARKRSVKDEFSMAKELMAKVKMEENEEDNSEEVKVNTNKNQKIGNNALDEISDDSESESSSESN